MNPATGKHEDNVVEAMLYMALELSNKTWGVTFGDGARRRQVSVPAGDLAKLGEALSQAKERFGCWRSGQWPYGPTARPLLRG